MSLEGEQKPRDESFVPGARLTSSILGRNRRRYIPQRAILRYKVDIFFRMKGEGVNGENSFQIRMRSNVFPV